LDEPFQLMIMVVRSGGSGAFQIFGGDVEYSTLEQARAHAETHGRIAWRESTGPLEDEQPCFLCRCTMGKLLEARERHPERICQVCALEAVDAEGRRICFGNGPEGGVRAWYADTGAPYDSRECSIRGVVCHAAEARFGGIVIERWQLKGSSSSNLR
jgi:hypothetical protein